MFLEYAWLKANFAYTFKIHMGNQIFRPRALDVSKIGNLALSLYSAMATHLLLCSLQT